jgi:flagellin
MISVSTNSAALTAQRYLGQSSSAASSSIAKISSGSRIVRASDDASALAISNKLRADISALQQASRNASQGASLLQVANGALDRISDILTRMKTLATQVVNGTLSNIERQYSQQEFSQLVNQIQQISDQTRWNGQPLLNGGDKSLANVNPSPTVNQTGQVAGLAAVAGIFTNASIVGGAAGTIDGYVEGPVRNVAVTEPSTGQYQIEVTIGTQTFRGFVSAGTPANAGIFMQSLQNNHSTFVLSNTGGAVPAAGNAAAITANLNTLFQLSDPGTPPANFQSNASTTTNAVGVFTQDPAATLADVISANGGVADGTYTVTSRAVPNANGVDFDTILRLQNNSGEVFESRIFQSNVVPAGTETQQQRVLFSNGLELIFQRQQLASTTAPASFTAGPPVVIGAGNIGTEEYNSVQFSVTNGTATTLSFQVGERGTDLITIGFSSTTAANLGLDTVNIETLAGGQAASAAIDNAVIRVNNATAQIGAIQSRMEYVEANIATITENLTAAKGVFFDVDFAAEVTESTKQQTLTSAGVSMLAQANQLPQQLLNLLQ